MASCRMCGRRLKPAEDCEPDDPARDCGGDCWGCMEPIERELEEIHGPIKDRIAEYAKQPNVLDARDLGARGRITVDGTEW